jgi:uncharacterized protein|tara:strand:+ start:685 stop:1602 length:918 start_codon:yes stop_codon:yes gene_type:complete
MPQKQNKNSNVIASDYMNEENKSRGNLSMVAHSHDQGDYFVEKHFNPKWIDGLLVMTMILVLLTAFPTISFGQDFLPNRPTGMVSDFADMLTSSEEQRLERKLTNYRDTTTNVIAIATLESLQGYSEEEIATTLFNNWRMWEGERYNGVLILVSKQDRRMQIEVGYGLEGAIPDAMANRVYADILVPNFRNGNFYNGLDRATDALIQLAAGEFSGFPERRSSSDDGIPVDLIILFIIIIFFLVSRGKGGKGGRRRSLGSNGVIFFGGGFGGGGGSSFGGGGGGGFGGFSGGGGFGSGGGGAGGGW